MSIWWLISMPNLQGHGCPSLQIEVSRNWKSFTLSDYTTNQMIQKDTKIEALFISVILNGLILFHCLSKRFTSMWFKLSFHYWLLNIYYSIRSESEEAAAKLKKLKEAVKSTQAPVTDYKSLDEFKKVFFFIIFLLFVFFSSFLFSSSSSSFLPFLSSLLPYSNNYFRVWLQIWCKG